MMYHNGGVLGAGKTLWQLNPHFGVQVLLKVKKAPSGVGAWHRDTGQGRAGIHTMMVSVCHRGDRRGAAVNAGVWIAWIEGSS